jgi:hypothetical protein
MSGLGVDDLTHGVRLAYTPGPLGLHFRIMNQPDSYPDDDALGNRDMAYINRLIETDEVRRMDSAEARERETFQRLAQKYRLPRHAGSCSNQNALDPAGAYKGVEECGCNQR